MAVTSSGRGYWLLGRDGGVFASGGDAAFLGPCSGCAAHQGQPAFVAISATPDTRSRAG